MLNVSVNQCILLIHLNKDSYSNLNRKYGFITKWKAGHALNNVHKIGECFMWIHCDKADLSNFWFRVCIKCSFPGVLAQTDCYQQYINFHLYWESAVTVNCNERCNLFYCCLTAVLLIVCFICWICTMLSFLQYYFPCKLFWESLYDKWCMICSVSST